MNYEFNYNLNNKDLFGFSINHHIHSISFAFDIIFSAIAIVFSLYLIVSNKFFELSIIRRILLVFSCLIFTIIQPLIVYIKSSIHSKKMKDLTIKLVFNDDCISISANTQNTKVLYQNVYDFIKYNDMIVLMYDAIYGQIIPNRVFDNNKDKFFDDIKNKILYYRSLNNEKK